MKVSQLSGRICKSSMFFGNQRYMTLAERLENGQLSDHPTMTLPLLITLVDLISTTAAVRFCRKGTTVYCGTVGRIS